MAEAPNLTSLTAEYAQEQDCCGSPEYPEQNLRVEVHDGGGGYYLVISTERWAVDASDLDALAARLHALLRAAGEGE
jgi:hypothetical protein